MQYATWKMIQELNAALRTGRLTDLGYDPCPRCRELISPDAIVCPYCGGAPLRSLRVTEIVEEVTVRRAAGPTVVRKPRVPQKGKVGA